MDRLSRKDFLKLAGFTVLGMAGCKFGDAATQTAATAGQPVNAAAGSAAADGISRAKVYFTDKINEDSMVKLSARPHPAGSILLPAHGVSQVSSIFSINTA